VSEVEQIALYSCGTARGKVTIRFKPEVQLQELVAWAMGFTCKNFVYSSAIATRSAKVTIIAPTEMSATEAWRVFLVSLQTMNLTIVPKGKVLEILEAPQAKAQPLPLYLRGAPAGTEQVVRLLIRPEHVAVDELATAIGMLKSKLGEVLTIPSSGMLLVTDYGSHIAKMAALVGELDKPGEDERLYSIRVRNADAVELADTLREILGEPAPRAGQVGSRRSEKGGTRKVRGAASAGESPTRAAAPAANATPSRIVADGHTNALFVVGTEAAYQRVRALVGRLDPDTDDGGAGQMHTYELENADAEELATTLTSLIGGNATSSNKGARGARNGHGGKGIEIPALEGQVRIAFDGPTNSLVVLSSLRDFLALSKIVRRLDAPRKQVYIEAVILEVDSDVARELGVSFHGGKVRSDGSIIAGGLQHKTLASSSPKSVLGAGGAVGGLFGPVLKNSESLLGTSIPSFGVAVQALATKGTVNVLSSPHILTADNTPAVISVGENIPYKAGLTALPVTTGDGVSPYANQSIARQDVARRLEIKPHINNSNLIRLEIDLEIADVANPDFGDGLGPSWSTRTVKNTVWVSDQECVVIGGLVADRSESSETKVPLLGDLPLLGYLFKWSHRKAHKTNLLVVLTPHILHDRADARLILERRMRERRELASSRVNLAHMPYRPTVDYGRKRGLVEEINHVVATYESERKLLEELERKHDERPDGPVWERAAGAAPQETTPTTGPVEDVDANSPPK